MKCNKNKKRFDFYKFLQMTDNHKVELFSKATVELFHENVQMVGILCDKVLSAVKRIIDMKEGNDENLLFFPAFFNHYIESINQDDQLKRIL